MITRHLETSGDAQPADIARPVADGEDFAAMMLSNPDMVQAVVPPDEAAHRVIDAILADEPYVVTHGDLVSAVQARSDLLTRAAEQAR
jgi:hypothetical protein